MIESRYNDSERRWRKLEQEKKEGGATEKKKWLITSFSEKHLSLSGAFRSSGPVTKKQESEQA
jgi:hypothetical protein